MAKSLALNDTAIKAAKPKDKPYTMTDGRGLYLLVEISGGKLWRFKYDFNGKPRKMALGTYPDVPLKIVRERHQTARQLLANGIDPSAQRMGEKAAKRAATENSFANVSALWKEHWRKKITGVRTVSEIERRLNVDILPAIGSRSMNDIEAPEIIAIAKKIEARGARTEARRAVETCGMVFAWAIAEGHAKRNPAKDVKVSVVLQPHETTNHARVPLTEVPALLNAIENYDQSFVVRQATKALAITFVRSGELRQAQWSEFDFEEARWDVPAERMKKRRPHIVPLSRQAIEVLKALKLVTGHTKFVMPGRSGGKKPMSEDVFERAIARMGYEYVQTPHGLRGIASTILNENGYTKDVVELQLAHVKDKDENGNVDKTRAAYNAAKLLGPRRQMMQWYADHLDELRDGIAAYNKDGELIKKDGKLIRPKVISIAS